MKKYNIEGGIDFFSELYKTLEDEESNFKTEEDNNLCLITNQPLIDKFVTMECGHKFNYLPLFNDLVNHKKKFNNMESSATQLKQNEIRCPYCRKKTTNMLPYYEELGLEKINGVNYIDINYNNDIYNHNLICKPCEFIKINIYFNENSKNVIEFYKQGLNIEDCKFIKCNFMGTKINDEDNYYYVPNDEKHYCGEHKRIVYKEYKKEKMNKIKEEKQKVKQKEKEDKQQAKQKEKDEKQKAKQKEKDDKQEAKQKAKDELKKAVEFAKMNKIIKKQDDCTDENDNVVIGTSDVIIENHILCIEILKTGPKKGTQCGLKIYENNLCKRHTKITNKNIVID